MTPSRRDAGRRREHRPALLRPAGEPRSDDDESIAPRRFARASGPAASRSGRPPTRGGARRRGRADDAGDDAELRRAPGPEARDPGRTEGGLGRGAARPAGGPPAPLADRPGDRPGRREPAGRGLLPEAEARRRRRAWTNTRTGSPTSRDRWPRWSRGTTPSATWRRPGSSQGATLRLPDVGDEVFGFRLKHPLGKGAFARVFLAEQDHLAGRPVVLKVSAIEGTEPQTLAQLQHTNIVPIYSVHEDARAGLRAVCMPYFGGASLSAVLKAVFAANPVPRHGREFVEALEAVQAPAPDRAGGHDRRRPGDGGPDAPGHARRARLHPRDDLDRRPARRGLAARPPARRPPPRHQALEHPDQRRGAAPAPRLQPRPRPERRPRPRDDRRHDRLHGPRAPPARSSGRRPSRPGWSTTAPTSTRSAWSSPRC